MADLAASVPSLDLDLFHAGGRDDPYPSYRLLRDAGAVCHLARYDLYAVGRHQDLREMLADPQHFSSAQGVALNDLMNSLMAGTVLASDPPEHKRLREMLGRPLAPARLAALRAQLRSLASDRVARLRHAGKVEAMRDIAMLLPLTVVSEMVGLPEEGRERMLEWAAAAFNGMAPAGVALCDQAFPVMRSMVDYITDPNLTGRLRPGSWAAQLWAMVEAGQLEVEEFRSIIQGYVSPSLDTTIFAVGNLIWLLANHPEEWRALKEDRALLVRCVNESLRLESPALGFSRVAREGATIAGVAIPAGARIMTVLPSGNRDERRYADPDRFNIRRDATDHLAFGAGGHRCVGGSLAMLEISVVLEALLENVDAILFHGAERAENAVLRGFEKLEVTLH